MAILTKLTADNFKVVAEFSGEAYGFERTSKSCKQIAFDLFYPAIFRSIAKEPILKKYAIQMHELPNDAARVRAICTLVFTEFKKIWVRTPLWPRTALLDPFELVLLAFYVDAEKFYRDTQVRAWFDNGCKGELPDFENTIPIYAKELKDQIPQNIGALYKAHRSKKLMEQLGPPGASVPSEPSCWEQMLDSFCSFWVWIWQTITSPFS